MLLASNFPEATPSNCESTCTPSCSRQRVNYKRVRENGGCFGGGMVEGRVKIYGHFDENKVRLVFFRLGAHAVVDRKRIGAMARNSSGFGRSYALKRWLPHTSRRRVTAVLPLLETKRAGRPAAAGTILRRSQFGRRVREIPRSPLFLPEASAV